MTLCLACGGGRVLGGSRVPLRAGVALRQLAELGHRGVHQGLHHRGQLRLQRHKVAHSRLPCPPLARPRDLSYILVDDHRFNVGKRCPVARRGDASGESQAQKLCVSRRLHRVSTTTHTLLALPFPEEFPCNVCLTSGCKIIYFVIHEGLEF